jgi:hypothetical protein
VYPDSISQLADIGIDLNDAKALNGENFAYRIIDGTPTLWGYDFKPGRSFNFGGDSRIGSEPPQVDDDNNSIKMWLWTFE